MSCTTLYGVTKKGKLIEVAEFKNSHRGAMMVWVGLYRNFCDETKRQWEESINIPTREEHFKAIWALFRNPEIPREYRIVLGATFDHVILEQSKINEFIQAVRIFAEDYPVGHLLRQCDALSNFEKSKRYVGFAWNQTSVGETWPNAYKRGFSAFDEGWYLFSECEKYDKAVKE